MPRQVVPVTELDKVGLIEDVPPVALPPSAFSDCRNVRFRDGAVQKMEGDVNILPYVTFQDPNDILRYVAWWPNPNLSVFNEGYYLIIVNQLSGSVGVDNAYLVKVGDLGRYDLEGETILPVLLAPGEPTFKGEFIQGGNWQHTFFQGGFTLIINNGLQTPHFILDSENAINAADVPPFAELPGWDSYAVVTDPETGTESTVATVTAGVIRDFGDFLVAGNLVERGPISVNIGEFYDTGLVVDSVVQDTNTAVYQILFDGDVTDTLAVGDVIASDAEGTSELTIDEIAYSISDDETTITQTANFTIDLADPVFRKATESGQAIVEENGIIRSLPGVVRSSDIAAPGQIPANWNPFEMAVNTADEFTITNDGIVQDFVELQGNMYIYSNSSISVMARTGNATAPLSVRPVTTSYGALTTDSVLEFDGRHFVVGAQDIYIFGGHPGSIQSAGDGRVRDAFFNRLHPLNIENTFLLRYQQKDEIWICFANKDSTSGLVNEALIWNYRLNNWTKRDLQNVVAGDIAPIPGGGVPVTDVEFEGANASNVLTGGQPHINNIKQVDPQDIVLEGNGRPHVFDIIIKNDMPIVAATGAPILEVVLGENFATGNPALLFTAEGRVNIQFAGGEPVEGSDRFLQVPNVDSSPATTRDFNFAVELPTSIGGIPGDYNTTTYRDTVLYPVINSLIADENFTLSQTSIDNPADGFDVAGLTQDDDAPMRIHFVESGNTNMAFIIEFREIAGEDPSYSAEIDIVTDVGTAVTEAQLGDDARLPQGDVLGDLSTEEGTADSEDLNFTIDGQTGVGKVYYFDFVDILSAAAGTPQDIIDRVVYFFEGDVDTSTDPTSYASLPNGAIIFRGDRDDIALGDTSDGDAANSADGDAMDGGMANAGTTEDGDHRVNYTFVNDTSHRIEEPLTGAQLQDLLDEMNDGLTDLVTEYPFLIWVPDTSDAVTEFNLAAYLLPQPSNGNPEHFVSGADLDIEAFDESTLASIPPTIRFFFQREEYTYAGGYEPDGIFRGEITEALGFTPDVGVTLPTDPTAFTSQYAIDQRAAYAAALETRFNSTSGAADDWTAEATELDDGNWQIRITSVENAPYHFIDNISIFVQDTDTKTLGPDNPIEFGIDPADHFQVVQVQQGVYDYVNTQTGIRPGELIREVIEPAIAVRHIDQSSADGLIYFDFVSPTTVDNIVQLTGIDDVLPYQEWLRQVMAKITTITTRSGGEQWKHVIDADGLTSTSKAIKYDAKLPLDMHDPIYIPNPDIDPDFDPSDGDPNDPTNGIVNFTENRAHNIFEIIEFYPGNVLGDDGELFREPVSTIAQQGEYETTSTGAYVVLRVSDVTIPDSPVEGEPSRQTYQVPGETVFLFYVGGSTEGSLVDNLQRDLNRRAPRLRSLTTGSGLLGIQPSNYNDDASYVAEFVVNNLVPNMCNPVVEDMLVLGEENLEACMSIDRVRQLLDPNFFYQDEYNPKPAGQLPDRLLFGRQSNTDETDNSRGFIEFQTALSLGDQTITTIEYDVLRPWPKTQINFTVEFPIFAATRPWPDGAVTNKIIGADIGYSRPAYLRPEVARVEEPDSDPTTALIGITGQDAPTGYESFVERRQMAMAPEYTTEQLASVAMWTDGSTQEYFRGPDRYNALTFQATPTNNPGAAANYLSSTALSNTQFISEGYKVDMRVTGRFLNWRITDQIDDDYPLFDEYNKTFNQKSEWRLSGLQFDIDQAGRR